MSGPPKGFASTVFADEYANAVPPNNFSPPQVVNTGYVTVDPQYALDSYAKQYATVQRYDQVIIRTRRAIDIASRVTKMSLSLSTAELSELTINVDDPDFLLLGSGVFVGSPTVTYQGLQLQLAGIETTQGARGALVLRARSKFVQRLKQARGPLVVQGGPQTFIGIECGRVGMAYVTDTDAWVPGVHASDAEYYSRTSRDWQPYVQPTTLEAEDEIPSSWTTFKRLAQERGWLMFEAANVLYFAPPSFLFRQSRIVRVRYAGTPDANRTSVPKLNRSAYGVVVGTDGIQRPQVLTAGGLTAPDVIDVLEPPQCVYSQDQLGVSISFKVAAGQEGWFLPGCVVDLSGVPYFDGLYLCNTVTYDLDGPDVTVTASTPIDTAAQQGSSVAAFTGSGNQGVGGFALSGSDSSAAGLPVCGITMDHFLAGLRGHESSDRNLAPPFAGGPSGYYQYIESTWIGWVHSALGQSAADKYPTAHSAPKDVQTQVARFQVTQTQARFANDWGKSAAYHFYPKLADNPSQWHYVPGQEPGGGGKTNNPRVIDYVRDVLRRAGGVSCSQADSTVKKTRLATDFLHMALSQIGDTYVFGASDPVTEANPDSFDCSSLVQWALGRVGVKNFPRFSGDQWQHCRAKAISPAHALTIPGALLFIDAGRVQGGQHVGISMGDGKRDMAAHSPQLGVGVLPTTPGSWSRAALVPELWYPGAGTDAAIGLAILGQLIS